MGELPFFNLRFARQVGAAAKELAGRFRRRDPFAEVAEPRGEATASEAEKRLFYETGMHACARCKNTGIFSSFYGCNGRANGDGYGTERFSCSQCDFIVDFAYDQAGDSHYYEAAHWDQTAYFNGAPFRR